MRTVLQEAATRRPRRRLPIQVERARLTVGQWWAAGLVADGILLAGWLALSVWLSQFFPRIWPLMLALLCFAVGGIRFAANLAWHGLYTLSRARPPERRP